MSAKARQTPRVALRVKKAPEPAKLAKREQKRLEERQDTKEFWDRMERLGGKLVDGLVKVGPAVAGGVLGYIAFTPTDFTILHADLVAYENYYGPPLPGGGCEAHCYAEFNKGGKSFDWLLQCLEDCGDPPAPIVIGVTQTWRFELRILCYVHTLVPNLVVDVKPATLDLPWPLPDISTPGIYWSLRETLAFNIRLTADPEVQLVDDPIADRARQAAFAKVKSEVRGKLVLAGALGGFAGTLTLPAMLQGVGEVLKGIGEIVPG
jgi:hypothetical protein